MRAHAADLSRTYVKSGAGEEPSLIGFYSISMGRVSSSDLPENKGKKVPHAATPAALLAQLATDDRAARGEGKFLVLDALERIATLADQIGCSGTFLHAQTADLVRYYTSLGFRQIGRSDAEFPTMWISMKDIRATFLDAAGGDE